MNPSSRSGSANRGRPPRSCTPRRKLEEAHYETRKCCQGTIGGLDGNWARSETQYTLRNDDESRLSKGTRHLDDKRHLPSVSKKTCIRTFLLFDMLNLSHLSPGPWQPLTLYILRARRIPRTHSSQIIDSRIHSPHIYLLRIYAEPAHQIRILTRDSISVVVRCCYLSKYAARTLHCKHKMNSD